MIVDHMAFRTVESRRASKQTCPAAGRILLMPAHSGSHIWRN